MSVRTECFVANVVDVTTSIPNLPNYFALRGILEQNPKEVISLNFNLNYEDCNNYRYYGNTGMILVKKIKLVLSVKFNNHIHEVHDDFKRKYAYNIEVRILLEDTAGKIHVNFPQILHAIRTDNVIQFETQELLIHQSQKKIVHVCFNFNRLATNDGITNDLSPTYQRCSSLSFKNTDNVDLIVGNEHFSIHKEILCSKSDVFAAMFDHEMQEKYTNIIKIEDFQADVIEEMIKFAYTNEISETIEHPQDLYAVAHKYQMENLKAKCIEYLIFNLNFSNAASLYKFAKLYNVDGLTTTLNLFFKKYDTNMVQEESYRSYLCENINSENLEDILFLCAKFNESLEDVKKTAFTFIKNNVFELINSSILLSWFEAHIDFVYELFQFMYSQD